MNCNNTDSQFTLLKKRIPYDEAIHNDRGTYETILKDLLTDSKFICLSLLYPYEDYSDYELPKRYNNWQLRTCVELYNLADKISVKDYSENGISWSRLKDGLSQSLVNELVANVGIPAKESEEQNV